MIEFFRKRRSLLALALVVSIAIAYVGTQRWRGKAVEVVEVQPQTMRQSVVASGRVMTPARAAIGSVLTGRVVKVWVEEGTKVKPGDLLIQLDASELDASLKQTDAALERAKAKLGGVKELGLATAQETLNQAEVSLRWAQRDLKRNRELKASGFIGQAKLDEAERAQAMAKSQLDSARAQVTAQTGSGSQSREAFAQWREAVAARELAAAKLAQSNIRSESEATVLTRQVEPGDIVQPAKILLTLAVAGETRITAQIDEKNLAMLQVGQSATASADAYPDQHFAAQLYYLAPSVDAARGAVEARLRVPQPPAHLRADMTVSVEVFAAPREAALLVPAQAVRGLSTASPQVLVLNNGHAESRAVKAGGSGGGRIEILQGLRAGERVILSANINAGNKVHGNMVATPSALAVTK